MGAGRPVGRVAIALVALTTDLPAQPIEECVRRAVLPATIRPLAPAIRDSAHTACGRAAAVAPVVARTPSWGAAWVNSARASATSDGPVWLGRGLTLSASGGFAGSWKRLSFAAQPVAFWGQNLTYQPSRNSPQAAGEYSDPWYATIDRPYQFGDGGYGRIDAGESFVRADTRWIGGGVSTRRQVWGPARLQPLMLGGNAGGFPHVFVESGVPWNVGAGRIAGRWMVGRLDASGYGPAGSVGTPRIGVGFIGVFMPRGVRGIELGASRFFHLYDSASVRDLTTLTLPFNALVKTQSIGLEAGARQSNQLASVFLRVAPPASPLEVYAEFLRDDHAETAREALVAMGYDSGWLLGMTHAADSDGRRRTLTIEVTNGRPTSVTRVLPEAPLYTNTHIREGHTLRGMPLGSAALPGGGGVSVAWRRSSDRGGWGAAFAVMPLAHNQEGGAHDGDMTGYYSLELSRELMRGGAAQRWVARLEPGFGDVAGVNLAVGFRITR